MKKALLLLTVISIFCWAFNLKEKSTDGPLPATMKPLNGAYSPVVVLELFTSEGCSSCPPADKLLPELTKLGSNIIPLSFHVDYWNRLGWVDPFSRSEFSDRQRAYGEQFRLESVYTPQLVVNGEYESVGSNRGDAEAAIKKALKENAAIRLKINEVNIDSGKIQFKVNLEGESRKMNLVTVLVQKNAVMNVKAGENSGARLSHTNVVRAFRSIAASATVNVELSFPRGLDPHNWELIVYAQDKKDLKITGASVFTPQQIE